MYGTTGQIDWLTPKYIIEDLGPFNLDPCASLNRQWDNATKNYTIKQNGLKKVWKGFVWLNPPYGRQTGIWMEKLSKHPDGGIALVFIRSDTKWFQNCCQKASILLMLSGRISFIDGITGRCGRNGASAPSVLVGFGNLAKKRLEHSSLKGLLVYP